MSSKVNKIFKSDQQISQTNYSANRNGGMLSRLFVVQQPIEQNKNLLLLQILIRQFYDPMAFIYNQNIQGATGPFILPQPLARCACVSLHLCRRRTPFFVGDKQLSVWGDEHLSV